MMLEDSAGQYMKVHDSKCYSTGMIVSTSRVVVYNMRSEVNLGSRSQISCFVGGIFNDNNVDNIITLSNNIFVNVYI